MQHAAAISAESVTAVYEDAKLQNAEGHVNNLDTTVALAPTIRWSLPYALWAKIATTTDMQMPVQVPYTKGTICAVQEKVIQLVHQLLKGC